MSNAETEDIIKSTCTKVLKGELLIDELHNLWPKEANNNSFYQIIFQDLEAGVEHCPGFFYKKGVNVQQWEMSDLYRTILIDAILLDYKNKDEKFLEECRSSIIHSSALTCEEIKIKLEKICSEKMKCQIIKHDK